ncbi:hypothetical protein L1787_19110 [Acuticoccus sp. M5D2P5]|uniref:nickel/cobalt transporter n=1 Tax=Acuticoccus kalidii TaxID=2910977 RepID=UPI001F25D1C1|nr:hypothetical protein [Acuticoccus kalidii]MCF3935504.1 hypothetical protein [Acuticoccus kalidii]
MSSVPTVGTRALPVERRRPLRIVVGIVFVVAGFATLAAVLSSGLGLVDMARWAATQQRAFHTMVSELLNHNQGGAIASAGLIGACLAYGFLHAAIPGHGKFLIAGAGMSSEISTLRLVLLSLAASLAQAVTAIVLVYGSFVLLDITAGWAMAATDKVLVPISYVAILAIGIILIRRALKGLRGFWDVHSARFGLGRTADHSHGDEHSHDHVHDDHCGCGHRHGPTPEEADAIRNWRDAAMLIIGIGLRPCTGAVFVLVAAWRMNLLGVGVLSAFAMALGTGAFISLVALSAATARGATLFAAGVKHAGVAVPLLQLAAGLAITLIAVAFLLASLWPNI